MLLLACLIIILLLLSAMLRRRLERLLPAVAGTAVLLCFGLAMFQGLFWFPWIAAASAALCLLWAAREGLCGRGRALISRLGEYAFTPGLLLLLLLAGFLVFALRGHVVTGTDDIYYWAIEAKSVFAHQGLVDGAHHIAPRFMNYTPGMQLWQWLGAAVQGSCDEGVLFVLLGLFYVVYLVPAAGNLRWKQAYLLPLLFLALVAAPVLVNRDAYRMLRVDTAMGICLGYALCLTWRIAKTEQVGWLDWFTLAVTLGMLTLLKQAGILWSFLSIGLLLALLRGRSGKSRTALWLVAGVPVLIYGIWTVYCAAQGLSGVHTTQMNAAVSALFHGTWIPPEGLAGLPAALLRALITLPPAQQGTPLLRLPLLGWAAVMVLLPVLLGPRTGTLARQKSRAVWWLVTGMGLFFIGFLILFLSAFAGELASFVSGEAGAFAYLLERYMSPLLIGGLMLSVRIALEKMGETRRRWWISVGVGILALAMLAPWQLLLTNLNPAAYDLTEPDDFALLQEENFWTDDLEDPLNAVVLYGVNPTPSKRERLQYALFPVKVVAFFGDVDDAEFLRLLRDNHITHVVCMDDSNPTYAHAVTYCPDEYLDTCTPYAVQWDGDVPVIAVE